LVASSSSNSNTSRQLPDTAHCPLRSPLSLFLPDHRGETFHQLALREGKQWEARVARDLSDTVFVRVFPELCRALAVADGKAGGDGTGTYRTRTSLR
jgi:hypothetical protein